MKNILLVLLLANILYFMWGLLTEEESQPGVAFVKESDLGPPLDVTTGRDSDGVAGSLVHGCRCGVALRHVEALGWCVPDKVEVALLQGLIGEPLLTVLRYLLEPV